MTHAKPMTKTEAIELLRQAQRSPDWEGRHMEADDALCGLLLTLGHADVVEEWEKVRKAFA